jgi:hypothetical protein
MLPRYRRPPRVEEPQAFSWDPVMVLVCILFIVASLLFCSIPLGRDADADADRNSQGPVCQCGPVLCTSNRTQPGCAPPAYDLTCSAEAPRRHVWHPASARFNGTMASALRASGFDPEHQRLVIIVGVGHSGTSTVACELSGASDLARNSREGGEPDPKQQLGDPKLAQPKLRRHSKPAQKRKSLGRRFLDYLGKVHGYLGTSCMQLLITASSTPHRCAGT